MSIPVPQLERTTLRRVVLTAQAFALGGALGVGAGWGAAAQEATPSAGGCIPSAATMTMGATDMASPAAEATELLATPASDEITARAAAAVDNFVACWNSGDLGATLALVTPHLLQTSFGLADAQAAEAALPEMNLGNVMLLDTGQVDTYADGRASMDVTYQRGDYQYVDARWYLVERDGELLIDQEDLQSPRPEGDQAIVGYTIADDLTPLSFDQRSEIGPTPVLVLSGVNSGAETHVVRLVRLTGATTAATPVASDEAPAPVSAEQIAAGSTIGLIALEPGAREDLALVGLPEGDYALADDAVADTGAALTIATSPDA